MIKAIKKVGNPHAIMLGRAVLGQLGVAEGSKVHLTLSGPSLVITPKSGTMPQEQFGSSRERVNRRYAELFKRLA